MKLLSFGMSKLMSESDIELWNCSDAVIIPEAIKTPIKEQNKASYCIANKQGQTAYVYCLNTHNIDKETIFAPQWVINKLSLELHKVVLKTCVLSEAKYVGVRFYTKDDLKNDDIFKALSRYAHVQSNTIITLNINGKEIPVKIEKTEPNKEFVTLRNSDVFIEYLEKVDTFLPFLSKTSYSLGGTKPEGKTTREMAAEAALKRIALLESSKSSIF